MTKLISMTEFVLKNKNKYYNDFYREVNNYAKLLKQPLKLEMFVPCDENDNVLEAPCEENYTDKTGFVNNAFFIETYEYKNAKEKVIFQGWQLSRYNRGLTPIYNKEVGYINFFGNGKIEIICTDSSINLCTKSKSAVKTIEHLTHFNLQLNKNFDFSK